MASKMSMFRQSLKTSMFVKPTTFSMDSNTTNMFKSNIINSTINPYKYKNIGQVITSQTYSINTFTAIDGTGRDLPAGKPWNSIAISADGKYITLVHDWKGGDDGVPVYFSTNSGVSWQKYKTSNVVYGLDNPDNNGKGQWNSVSMTSDGLIQAAIYKGQPASYFSGNPIYNPNNIAILINDSRSQFHGGGSGNEGKWYKVIPYPTAYTYSNIAALTITGNYLNFYIYAISRTTQDPAALAQIINTSIIFYNSATGAKTETQLNSITSASISATLDGTKVVYGNLSSINLSISFITSLLTNNKTTTSMSTTKTITTYPSNTSTSDTYCLIQISPNNGDARTLASSDLGIIYSLNNDELRGAKFYDPTGNNVVWEIAYEVDKNGNKVDVSGTALGTTLKNKNWLGISMSYTGLFQIISYYNGSSDGDVYYSTTYGKTWIKNGGSFLPINYKYTDLAITSGYSTIGGILTEGFYIYAVSAGDGTYTGNVYTSKFITTSKVLLDDTTAINANNTIVN
jgi:hypothetical protein